MMESPDWIKKKFYKAIFMIQTTIGFRDNDPTLCMIVHLTSSGSELLEFSASERLFAVNFAVLSEKVIFLTSSVNLLANCI